MDFAYCHTEDFWEEIGEAIERSDVILFLMSKDYQNSKPCRQAVMYAKDACQKRFIPVYIKKDFVATGWLGIRIVGPQYIRFGKKPFQDTINELIKLINEDPKELKAPSCVPPPLIGNELTENTSTQTKPTESNHSESKIQISKKPIEKWTKQDILQWFDDNHIHRELVDLYDFRNGTDLLLYGQSLRSDWQLEYNDMRERYQQTYDRILYRDRFVRFVGCC